MIHLIAWIDRHAGILAALAAFVLTLLVLAGCVESPPPRPGTAQAGAAGAQARVDSTAHAVDQAGADLARLQGEAAAAEARAKATGIKHDIDAAVDARVRAVAAEAVHAALVQQEVAARATAASAEQRAAREHEAEQIAQDYRAWVRLCRLVGAAGILGGFLLAAVLAWATGNPRAGLWPGGILAAAGALAITLGPATSWLPWIVGLAAAVGILWAALGHRRERQAKELAHEAVLAGSRAVDAVEREIGAKAKAAKSALAGSLAAAGLADLVEARRGPLRDWTTPAQGT